MRKANFPSGDEGQSHRSVRSVLSSATPSDASGDGEGVWPLMETKIVPKQAIVTATNSFFISSVKFVVKLISDLLLVGLALGLGFR